jgi:hypothetical protein
MATVGTMGHAFDAGAMGFLHALEECIRLVHQVFVALKRFKRICCHRLPAFFSGQMLAHYKKMLPIEPAAFNAIIQKNMPSQTF